MSDASKIMIVLGIFLLFDLLIIGGILWKGHANFIELYKHLKK